ncbi:coiled-coil domain-containing protein 85C-like protein [Dinothrombium tinctorium]|uniref:Coiled-coil domain-containing protein 85C-like protein n=1 Tax=Dinothrombium tinctorium TaxID=1965070 RepID=A0A3S4QTK2_9ACAR|nr:coiled-coil domain-containing protein 85C-like protein [Dinothrombium tinctorium]RWS07624.1 coiled-coil domain-containing protein 85C-like protein [Dinothrombium tinctorium]
MSSSSLSNLPGMGPPASPPLQHAPPPPTSHGASQSSSHHSLHSQHSGSQRMHVRSPTATVTTPPPQTPDDELLGQLSREELIARIRSLEARNRKLLYDNGAMMKDINHHLTTIQQLKRSNYQLMTDNTELRDMCCYLDDERSRARAVSREWQSFGTHMSRVMRHEVKNYSTKLSQLETKQFELVRENFELKQLCLLLDNAIATRENGDGSTSSSNMDDVRTTTESNSNCNNSLSTNNHSSQQQHRVILSQQILEYIRSLEAKITQLEWEKKQLCDLHSNPDTMDSYENNSVSENNNQPPRDCPAAIAEAMRVLRIQESLNDSESLTSNRNADPSENGTAGENDSNNVSMEQQRALVRSLCNVAWRKIEDGS